MICSEDGKEMLEISGNLSYEDNEVKKWPNTWLNHQSPPEVQALYKDYLGEPGSEKAEHLLHTDYHKRDLYKFAK